MLLPMKKTLLRLLRLLPLALASCVLVVDDGRKEGSLSAGSGDGSGSETREGSADDASARGGGSGGPKANAQAMEQGVFPYPVHEKRLPNGLLVLVVPMPSDGLVSYWSIVRTGSRDEFEPGVTGFAHFFEHMMFRGTESYPADVYDQMVNGMGADANAFTTDDLTAYHLSITEDDLPTVVEIETDRFQNLAYDEAQFKTEAGAVYGEYRKSRTAPFEVLVRGACATRVRRAHLQAHHDRLRGGHPGDAAAVRLLEDLLPALLPARERRDPASPATSIRPQTFALVEEVLRGWKTGYVAPKIAGRARADRAAAHRRAFRRPDACRSLQIAFKGERFLPGDRAHGRGQPDRASSRSARPRRSTRSSCSTSSAASSWARPSGYQPRSRLWSVYAMIKDPADVAAVEGEIWGAVDALARALPSENDLDDRRARACKYGFLSRAQTPDGVVQQRRRSRSRSPAT